MIDRMGPARDANARASVSRVPILLADAGEIDPGMSPRTALSRSCNPARLTGHLERAYSFTVNLDPILNLLEGTIGAMEPRDRERLLSGLLETELAIRIGCLFELILNRMESKKRVRVLSSLDNAELVICCDHAGRFEYEIRVPVPGLARYPSRRLGGPVLPGGGDLAILEREPTFWLSDLNADLIARSSDWNGARLARYHVQDPWYRSDAPG
jgi:hypothetical protein